MHGDKYQVFTATGRHSALHATFDTWATAKETRNELFFGNGQLRSAWVMRVNPELNLRPELWGHTLRRTKHETF